MVIVGYLVRYIHYLRLERTCHAFFVLVRNARPVVLRIVLCYAFADFPRKIQAREKRVPFFEFLDYAQTVGVMLESAVP